MINVHPEYVVDEHSKKKSVVLPYEEWEEIVEALEDLEDIQAYDLAKADQSPSIPFEQAVKEIENRKGK